MSHSAEHVGRHRATLSGSRRFQSVPPAVSLAVTPHWFRNVEKLRVAIRRAARTAIATLRRAEA